MSYSRTLLLGLFIFSLGVARSVAAEPSPSEALLRAVPPETSICVVVRDLSGHVKQLRNSPFFEWYANSDFAKRYGKPKEVAILRGVIEYLAAELKVTPLQFLDDILGDAVVLAYQPSVGDTQESGIILVHARKPELLANLIERVNQLQQESGEIREVIQAKHGDTVYAIRVKSNQEREYYFLHGSLFAFSGQQSAIHAVIDRASSTDAPIYQSLKRLGIEEALAVLWFNPRQFDQEFAQSIKQSNEQGDRNALLQFQAIWTATQSLAMTVDFDEGIDARFIAQVNEIDLPAKWRSLLMPSPHEHSLWSIVPDDAILAVGGRIHLPELLAALRSISNDRDREQLDETIRRDFGAIVGKSKLDPLLAGIGPSWLLWVAPPNGNTWVPTTRTVIELQGDDPELVTRSLKQAIDLGLQFLRVQHNRDHDLQIDIDTKRIDDVIVQFLDYPLFPRGFRPSYAIIAQHLVVGSSPESVATFQPPMKAIPSDRILWFSPEELRRYLLSHREALSKGIAKTDNRDDMVVRREVDDLSMILELFRTVEVSYKVQENRIVLSIHVECHEPLKK